MYVAWLCNALRENKSTILWFSDTSANGQVVKDSTSLSVADPGFSRGGREPSRGGVNTPKFPENCMKSKEFGRPGGGVRPSRPP